MAWQLLAALALAVPALAGGRRSDIKRIDKARCIREGGKRGMTPEQYEMLEEACEASSTRYAASVRESNQSPVPREGYLPESVRAEAIAQNAAAQARPDRAEYLPEYDNALQKREAKRALLAQQARETQKELEWEMSKEGRRAIAQRDERQLAQRVAHLENINKPAQYPTKRMVAGGSGIRIDPTFLRNR